MTASRSLAALVVLALAGLISAGLASAQPVVVQPQTPPSVCDVPAYLLHTDSLLPKVNAAIKAGRLDILVIGSRSSTIASAEGQAYPGRLEALLREKLPAAKVSVTVELQPKRTAAEIAGELDKMVEARKPSLVIWQTGTYDAMRAIDPDDFSTAIDDGLGKLQKAGVDTVLMNLQYSPRTDSVISPTPYVDSMRLAAQDHDVPLFDRFAMMRQWSDSGDFDLFNSSPGLDLARKVHDCLGRALTLFVLDAARDRPTPVQPGLQQ